MKQKNELVNYVLVAALVVGAYLLGSYKTKYDLLQGDGGQKEQARLQQPSEAEAKKTALSQEEWQELLKDPVAVKGKEEAPVTIVEFTDYQCPFCARYFEEAYQDIMRDYVEKGKVRYILRNLPLPFHKNADEAAVAAYCAGKEGKYWEMHDKLFEKQKEWEGEDKVEELFARYGDELGVNIRECQKSKEAREVIAEDMALARKVGASGTPTFFINGKLLVGAQPYEAFKAVIEEALK